ncbi:MAG: hypothetical protein ACFFFC_09575 [Candidatus Thorarchaeota archaeon]
MFQTEAISGKILTSQIGYFGKGEIAYGFITVETREGIHLTLKIDAYTKYDTIKVGDQVRITVHRLADTDILVAREIVTETPFATASKVKDEAS